MNSCCRDRTANPFSETGHDQTSTGVIQAPGTDLISNAGHAWSPGPSSSSSVSPHDSKALLEGVGFLDAVDAEVSYQQQSRNVACSSITDSHANGDHGLSLHCSDSISIHDTEDIPTQQLSGSEMGHQWTFSGRSTSGQRTLGSATYATENAITLDCPVGASTGEDSSIECVVRGASCTEQYEVKQESERMQGKAETELSHEHSVTISSL